MTIRIYLLVVGLFWGVIAVLHALRLAFGWEAVIGGHVVPHWLSWVALGVSSTLCIRAFQLRRAIRDN